MRLNAVQQSPGPHLPWLGTPPPTAHGALFFARTSGLLERHDGLDYLATRFFLLAAHLIELFDKVLIQAERQFYFLGHFFV